MATDPRSQSSGADKPHCYGSDEWDAKDPVCRGGYDPAYVGEKGSHVREECIFYRSCGLEQMSRHRQNPTQQLIPVSNLVRPMVPQPIRQVFQQTNVPSTPTVPQYQPQMNGVAPYYQPSGTQLMPVSYIMPGYLTTPQDPSGGVGVFRAAAGDAIRAGLKGAFHQLAHFIDKQPFFSPGPSSQEK